MTPDEPGVDDLLEAFTVHQDPKPVEPGPPDVSQFNSVDGAEFVPAKRQLPYYLSPEPEKAVTSPGEFAQWTPYGWVEPVPAAQVHTAKLPLADN